MLVLKRRKDDRIRISHPDGPIWLTVVGFDSRGSVRLGFQGPESVTIDREEVHDRKEEEDADSR